MWVLELEESSERKPASSSHGFQEEGTTRAKPGCAISVQAKGQNKAFAKFYFFKKLGRCYAPAGYMEMCVQYALKCKADFPAGGGQWEGRTERKDYTLPLKTPQSVS